MSWHAAAMLTGIALALLVALTRCGPERDESPSSYPAVLAHGVPLSSEGKFHLLRITDAGAAQFKISSYPLGSDVARSALMDDISRVLGGGDIGTPQGTAIGLCVSIPLQSDWLLTQTVLADLASTSVSRIILFVREEGTQYGDGAFGLEFHLGSITSGQTEALTVGSSDGLDLRQRLSFRGREWRFDDAPRASVLGGESVWQDLFAVLQGVAASGRDITLIVEAGATTRTVLRVLDASKGAGVPRIRVGGFVLRS